MSARRRPGTYAVVTAVALPAGVRPFANVLEEEGNTWVVALADAERHGLQVGLIVAWLTLEVHSALDAVGLTAACSGALAAAGIACNVLAGYHHDHLLVPVDDAKRALAILAAWAPVRADAERGAGRPEAWEESDRGRGNSTSGAPPT